MRRILPRDPRYFQIAVLSGLLLYGLLVLDFEVTVARALTILAAALGCQALFSRWAGIPFDPRSPLISALSLCLLLRTGSWVTAVLVAAVTIGSKFALRSRGKHVFNPTNFGLVIAMALSPWLPGGAWVSPGQWGQGIWLAFLLAGLGSLVVRRAERSDVTWAFLAFHLAIVFGRAAWLGDPWAIPLHGLESGALLIFAFFMISDPKTTPDSRTGRIVFAALVAAGGAWVSFGLFRPHGLLWSLAVAALLVPLLDRLFPARRYHWPGRAPSSVSIPTRTIPIATTPTTATLRPRGALAMRRILLLVSALLVPALLTPSAAHAFCGFYVAKADTSLYNDASQVVLVRDGDRTVLTMANDYQGDPTEFAMVVPVPTVLQREQIHVGEKALIDHLDAYTAPRLVEYFDEDPCRPPYPKRHALPMSAMPEVSEDSADGRRARSLGVTIEASYTVGEYDILILSARESEGLLIWLRENEYRIPDGAEAVIASYLKQGMKFFVAKVNLDEQAKLGTRYLRPLQMAFETPKFMLPIRLGTVNARGAQELFVYTLTRPSAGNGRVETTNYRTVKLPTGQEIPTFVKAEFNDFYRDLFSEQVRRERHEAVFVEYAWNMAWCDPCAAEPLSAEELQELGVFWLAEAGRGQPAQDVFVTRLHVRYDRDHFPEDLRFQHTGDTGNFQGRYVLRHPWQDEATCPAARDYYRQVAERQHKEAETLASLTGWELAKIHRKIDFVNVPAEGDKEPWWRRIWGTGGR